MKTDGLATGFETRWAEQNAHWAECLEADRRDQAEMRRTGRSIGIATLAGIGPERFATEAEALEWARTAMPGMFCAAVEMLDEEEGNG